MHHPHQADEPYMLKNDGHDPVKCKNGTTDPTVNVIAIGGKSATTHKWIPTIPFNN